MARLLVTGYWLLVTGYWLLVTRHASVARLLIMTDLVPHRRRCKPGAKSVLRPKEVRALSDNRWQEDTDDGSSVGHKLKISL